MEYISIHCRVRSKKVAPSCKGTQVIIPGFNLEGRHVILVLETLVPQELQSEPSELCYQ